MLNNLAYVGWTTSLPLLLARLAKGNSNLFATDQGISMTLVSLGFLSSSLLGGFLGSKKPLISLFVWAASFLGFFSVLLLGTSLLFETSLYLSAFLSGVGTYCFRISGMTLGQAFTPPEDLGSVIIAGDALVRGWSFLVSLLVIGAFQIHNYFNMHELLLILCITFLPGLSLFAPFLLTEMTKIFVERNRVRGKKSN
jgi:hypothetical protein